MAEFIAGLVIVLLLYSAFKDLFSGVGRKSGRSSSTSGGTGKHSGGSDAAQHSSGIYVDPEKLDLAEYQLRTSGIDYSLDGDSIRVDPDDLADAVNAMQMEEIDTDWY